MTSESKSESFASLLAEADQGSMGKAMPRRGDKVDAVVSKVGQVAVFVTLQSGIEAYIERGELLGKDGKVSVEVGTKVVGKVVEIGGRSGAIRLSPLVIKTGDDEAAEAAPTVTGPVLVEGLKVKGQVTRVERYGVFVQITGTQGRKGRGLLPASESGTPRGADLTKVFPVGSEIETKIVRVEEDGKIRLSIIAMKSDEERGQYESYAKKSGGESSKKPAEARVGTFGALLQKQLAASATKKK